MILHHIKHFISKNEKNCEQLAPFAQEILILESLQLHKLNPQLKALYANDGRGRKPIEPLSMLQSLMMMILQGEVSFTKWVKTTRTNPLIALLCGFSPEHTPGVGTYYDFLNRLEDGPFKKYCQHDKRASQLEAGKHLRNVKAERLDEDKEVNQTAQLVELLLKQVEQPNPDDLQNRLQSYLKEIALTPSVHSQKDRKFET